MTPRPIGVICTQCGRLTPDLRPECDRYRRRVYLDTLKQVGASVEVDAVEREEWRQP